MARGAVARRPARRRTRRPTSEDEPAEDHEDAPARGGVAAEQVVLVARGRGAAAPSAWPPRPRTPPRCVLVGLVRSGTHVGVSRLRKLVLGAPAVARRRRSRPPSAIHDYDEDEVLLDSAVKASDGFFTTFFVSPVLALHRALGARAAASRPTRSRPSRCSSALARGRRVRHRRALGPRRRRDPAAGRVHHRLRGRPARPLHAHLLQARRLAGLDLRPHEGVPRVRRPGDRREPHRRPGLAARVRGAHAADGAPLVRLRVRRRPDQGRSARPSSRRSSSRATPRARPRPAACRARAGVRAEAARPAAPAARAVARAAVAARLARAWTALPGVRWVKKMIAFPIGERFAAISITAALFDAARDVRRAARLGRHRRRLLPRRPRAALHRR